MSRSVSSAAFGLFLLAAAAPAAAETLSDGRALNPASPLGKYILSGDFYQGMFSFAVQSDRALGLPCDGSYDIKPVTIVVYQPVQLPDGAKQATAGAWSYRFDAVRCGTAKRYNLMFVAQADGAPRPNLLLPGDTITSPLLAMDALPAVGTKANFSIGKECKDVQVFDTQLTEPPQYVSEGQNAVHGAWKEKWVFQGCGKKVAVPVSFVPDDKGGISFHTDR